MNLGGDGGPVVMVFSINWWLEASSVVLDAFTRFAKESDGPEKPSVKNCIHIYIYTQEFGLSP